MHGSERSWLTLIRTDVIVSLGGIAVTLATTMYESFQLPWSARIFLSLGVAYFALMLWRQLSLRRLLMPTAIQKSYEDDLLYVSEVFSGRAMVSNITFRRTELKGPGAIYLEGNCRLGGITLFNPHIHALLIVPQNQASMLPFFRFRNCVFDDCIFSGVGLLADESNYFLFGLTLPPQPPLPMQPASTVPLPPPPPRHVPAPTPAPAAPTGTLPPLDTEEKKQP